jgi:hypothetical protein
MKAHTMLRGGLLAVVLLVLWGDRLGAAPVPGSGQGQPGKLPPPCFGLLVASVQNGMVYTITESRKEGSITVRLWEASLRPLREAKPEGASRTFRDWEYTWWLNELHWRMAYGHVWAECVADIDEGSCHKIPLEDLPLLDVANVDQGTAALRKKYRDDRAGDAWWYSGSFMDADHDLWQKIYVDRLPGLGERLGIQRDILPTGPRSWDLFFLYESRLHIWRCSEKAREGPVMRSQGEKCGEAIDAGFQEPFFVYGKPEAPFFVTKSGKVFQCLRPKGKEPRVVKVWDDPKRQVRTILNDADTNRTFVAGPDPAEGEGQWFYFELTEKPEKKPFDRSAVTAHAQEPLQSALIFARFLVKEGKIKDKAQ